MQNIESKSDGSLMFPLHILQVSIPTEFTAHSSEHSREWCMRHPFFFHSVFFSCVNMTDFEQRTVIKFLSKRNNTNVEMENELFEVWGDAAYKKSTVQKWTKRFCEDRKSLQDNDRVWF